MEDQSGEDQSGEDQSGENQSGESKSPRIPLRALFLGFFTVGICGFGGVLPWARRVIVERRRWMTAGEFADLLALCQFLPGGNVINMSVAVGARFGGVPGVIAAFLGLMIAPVTIVILLGVAYARFEDDPLVRRAFAALAAAASGLVLATALKIAAPLRTRPLDIGIATLSFVAIAVLRLPLLGTMAVLAPLACLLVGLRRR
jgi:chromate transporter